MDQANRSTSRIRSHPGCPQQQGQTQLLTWRSRQDGLVASHSGTLGERRGKQS
jgi:hypothetical protein